MEKRPQDQALVEHLMVLRAQLGDHDAFHGLFQRYNPRLLYFLRHRFGHASGAEDVLQDVWLTVVKKVATLERPEAFRAWVYRIARNRAISRLRRERRNVSLDTEPDVLEVESAAPNEVDGERFAGYDASALHAGLGRLSPVHREVLTLRFIDELTYEEIAKIVGCSLGTVRSRIHYAKRSLLENLGPSPVDPSRHRGAGNEKAPPRRKGNHERR